MREATDAIIQLINMTLIQDKLEAVELGINQLEQEVENHAITKEDLDIRPKRSIVRTAKVIESGTRVTCSNYKLIFENLTRYFQIYRRQIY